MPGDACHSENQWYHSRYGVAGSCAQREVGIVCRSLRSPCWIVFFGEVCPAHHSMPPYKRNMSFFMGHVSEEVMRWASALPIVLDLNSFCNGIREKRK